MAHRKDEALSEESQGCWKCHREPFLRMLHLLRNFSDERAVAGHLKEDFGQKDGFIDSELKWRRFIIEHYSGEVDGLGDRVPVWLAFARSKCIVTKTDTGWHMKPKPYDPPTANDIWEAFRNSTGNRWLQ